MEFKIGFKADYFEDFPSDVECVNLLKQKNSSSTNIRGASIF